MAHIDTLKIYEEYRAAGLDEKTAKEFTNILENSFATSVKEWLKDAKEDFASQKMVSIIGALILLIMTAGVSLMWYISIDLQVLKTCGMAQQEIKQDK